MKSLGVVALLLLALGIGMSQECPSIDLSQIPPPTGPKIEWAQFQTKLNEIFSGGVCSTNPRILPTPNDCLAMLNFVQPFLSQVYPGNKAIGLFGLLAKSSWKEAAIVLYLYRDEFGIGVLTTEGWRIIREDENGKLEIASPAFKRKPMYFGL